MAKRECPDGGYCHHQCVTGCFRVATCAPLSGRYENDEWPASIEPLKEVVVEDGSDAPMLAKVLGEDGEN